MGNGVWKLNGVRKYTDRESCFIFSKEDWRHIQIFWGKQILKKKLFMNMDAEIGNMRIVGCKNEER